MTGTPRGTPAWLVALLAVFLLAIAAIVGASLVRPEVPVFEPGGLAPRAPPSALAGPDTVTLDARAGEGWVGIDLATRESGDVRSMPATWDIAAQRHRLIVNGGEGFLGDAGVVAVESPIEAVRRAPEGGYAGSRVTPGGDSVQSALDEWYAYHFLSHLLEPAERTYVVRTARGPYAKVRVLGYYCPGVEPGCVTLEFTLQGDGSRALAPASGG
ncbi:MAG TPA: HmuY family protein [Longimicrobiales bacterium]|nr:HmuY family protein [Longimicrobiales bacterium]